MRKRITALLAATLLSLGVAFSVAGPARAAVPNCAGYHSPNGSSYTYAGYHNGTTPVIGTSYSASINLTSVAFNGWGYQRAASWVGVTGTNELQTGVYWAIGDVPTLYVELNYVLVYTAPAALNTTYSFSVNHTGVNTYTTTTNGHVSGPFTVVAGASDYTTETTVPWNTPCVSVYSTFKNTSHGAGWTPLNWGPYKTVDLCNCEIPTYGWAALSDGF